MLKLGLSACVCAFVYPRVKGDLNSSSGPKLYILVYVSLHVRVCVYVREGGYSGTELSVGVCVYIFCACVSVCICGSVRPELVCVKKLGVNTQLRAGLGVCVCACVCECVCACECIRGEICTGLLLCLGDFFPLACKRV